MFVKPPSIISFFNPLFSKNNTKFSKSLENKLGLPKSNSLNLKSGNKLLSKASIFLSHTPNRVEILLLLQDTFEV